jgi:hypothetical protein
MEADMTADVKRFPQPKGQFIKTDTQVRDFLRIVPEGSKVLVCFIDPVSNETRVGLSGECTVQEMDHMYMSIQRHINALDAS